MPEQESKFNPEQDLKADLLVKINNALAELGSKSQYRKAPEFKPGYEGLEGKTVVMVEDVADIIEVFIPDLMVATQGNVSFVKYDRQELELLVAQVLAKNPDIILMDYNLSDTLKGTRVLGSLQDRGFAGQTIGFSSDPYTTEEFIEAGAIGGIDKAAFDTSASVAKIAKLVSGNK